MPARDKHHSEVKWPAEDALQLHPFYRGKIQLMPKCPIETLEDLSVWYTPGVAAPCKAIAKETDLVYSYTNRANSIAIVTDGSRVLGLGDIGPEASLPVMEGKALLFKYLGGVDAVPICLGTQDPTELIDTVRRLQPSFGGINLEDIAQPKCFVVLDALRRQLNIPLWHDDQQGTATVLLAALANALKVVDKELDKVTIALIGAGAAGVAAYRFLKIKGIDLSRTVVCDRRGILHRGRDDLEASQKEYPDKWRICLETNERQLAGGIPEALEGSDVCISFSRSGPGVIEAGWVANMARDAVVFACANPVPEIWPWQAEEAGARIVATGRSDFPNQLNNSLAFPGIFRGVLDVRARTVTDEMALAAASEIARFAEERGIHDGDILPRMDEWELYPRIAVATAMKAQSQGIAGLHLGREELYRTVSEIISTARESSRLLMREGLIKPLPRRIHG
jgi:malate dehydrogenase (oxaloacetate-decarboxylating)